MLTAEHARENKFQSKLLEESLKLHALNEQEFRKQEQAYMRDFAEICGISLPAQLIDYKTFVEMARSKVLRLNTKIQILTTAKEGDDTESLSQKYRKPEPVTINMFKTQLGLSERLCSSRTADANKPSTFLSDPHKSHTILGSNVSAPKTIEKQSLNDYFAQKDQQKNKRPSSCKNQGSSQDSCRSSQQQPSFTSEMVRPNVISPNFERQSHAQNERGLFKQRQVGTDVKVS